MTDRPTTLSPARRRLAAAFAGAALVLAGCSAGNLEEDAPAEEPGTDPDGGAVGPDTRVTDDLSLLQVQLEYPLDGLYEVGDDARLFMAIANTGGEPVTLTDISGPDFGGVRVETEEGQGLPLTVDSQDNLYVGAEGPPEVTLLDLGQELRSSQSIPVTFTFAEAGEVTIEVPVSAEGQTPTQPFDFPNDDPDQDPTENDPAAPSGSATPTG
ncbi:copper chaperone PCu(A)C [Geodermatophilus sp. DF01-2]|uniref:copper chaperone PCu(A)C n=1 Tax=Geodermatophilus sp. DF01-2 TaxID=2559610 RepID=UPI0010739F09|nr:copper chaperone PCu(A)C [Geodermatophilus sp. DF01_2]TFV57705.1 copper chaperone PCu(A)C [Geodermatophilus sp. DF01_2]